MSVGFCITFIGLLTRRYIEQTPFILDSGTVANMYLYTNQALKNVCTEEKHNTGFNCVEKVSAGGKNHTNRLEVLKKLEKFEE